MRLFRFVIPLLFLSLSASSCEAAADALSLPELLLKAQDNNPELIAARQGWKVKQQEARAAGVWENPTFSYTDEKFPPGMAGGTPEAIKHYRVEQRIPFPGKLTQDARMRYHEALISQANYRAKELDVFRDIRMRYYQLYLTGQEIVLAQQSVEVLKNALASAQGRLGANRSSTSDVFMAQTELGRMKNRLYEQQQQRHLIEIELNTLLNQPQETLLGSTTAPALIDVPVSLKDLEKLTRANNPLYLNAMHEVNHSQAMQARNRLEWAPDFGVMYEREETDAGPAGRQIGVSVSFPLWFKRPWADSRAAAAHVIEAKSGAQAMQNMALKMVHMEFTETNTHLKEARNYLSDILPSAQSNLKIAQQQYASGQADFLRLLEAFRTWIEVHTEYQNQLYHVGEHWSELERWVGIDLSQARQALEQQEMNHDK